jgi:hypothetical protein
MADATHAIEACTWPDGPTGTGHITLTIASDGSTAASVPDSAPFAGTPVGVCIAEKFRAVRVPAFNCTEFKGVVTPVTQIKIGKRFSLS